MMIYLCAKLFTNLIVGGVRCWVVVYVVGYFNETQSNKSGQYVDSMEYIKLDLLKLWRDC